MTVTDLNCSECGGNVHLEGVQGEREYVCKDCGEVVESDKLVMEPQTANDEERKYEVEEL